MRVAAPHIGVEPCAGAKTVYRGDVVLDCTRQVYNLGNGGVPVHHDPLDGIFANHEK